MVLSFTEYACAKGVSPGPTDVAVVESLFVDFVVHNFEYGFQKFKLIGPHIDSIYRPDRVPVVSYYRAC